MYEVSFYPHPHPTPNLNARLQWNWRPLAVANFARARIDDMGTLGLESGAGLGSGAGLWPRSGPVSASALESRLASGFRLGPS